MKQNITDDACVVDCCALKNIALPSEIWPVSLYGSPRISCSYNRVRHLRYQKRQQFPAIKVDIEWTMRQSPNMYECLLLGTVAKCMSRNEVQHCWSLFFTFFSDFNGVPYSLWPGYEPVYSLYIIYNIKGSKRDKIRRTQTQWNYYLSCTQPKLYELFWCFS